VKIEEMLREAARVNGKADIIDQIRFQTCFLSQFPLFHDRIHPCPSLRNKSKSSPPTPPPSTSDVSNPLHGEGDVEDSKNGESG